MSYTKGPWMIDDRRAAKNYGIYVPEFPNMVATVNYRKDDSGEANARLIAAAPDLYETLKLLVRFHEKLNTDIEKIVGRSVAAVHLDEAKAAIAKAEGGR